MPQHPQFQIRGVIPAVLLPFRDDLSIDEQGFREHVRDVGATKGISAITVNGHSTEVSSCTFDEQRRIMDIAYDAVGDHLPIVHGIWADGSLEAVRIAESATAGGASALLVFPPAPFTLGHTPEMVLTHYRRIADATDLPLIAFQYPQESRQGFPPDTLGQLLEEVPSIRAVKDWSGNVPRHEASIRTLQGRQKPVAVLSTHSAWLLSSLVLGCSGLLSGSGSVIPELHVALFEAVRDNDLVTARAINDRIYPLARAFYAEPAVNMHNRMKAALVLLGRLGSATVRPPLVPLDPAEIRTIESALVAAGLLAPASGRAAA